MITGRFRFFTGDSFLGTTTIMRYLILSNYRMFQRLRFYSKTTVNRYIFPSGLSEVKRLYCVSNETLFRYINLSFFRVKSRYGILRDVALVRYTLISYNRKLQGSSFKSVITIKRNMITCLLSVQSGCNVKWYTAVKGHVVPSENANVISVCNFRQTTVNGNVSIGYLC